MVDWMHGLLVCVDHSGASNPVYFAAMSGSSKQAVAKVGFTGRGEGANFDFCSLRGHCDDVFEERGEFSGTPASEDHLRNLHPDGKSSECGEHGGERGFGLRGVPRAVERPPMTEAFGDKPEHDEGVEEHAQRRGAARPKPWSSPAAPRRRDAAWSRGR